MQVPVHYETGGADILSSATGRPNPVRFELVSYSDWLAFAEATARAPVGIVVGTVDAQVVRRLADLRRTLHSGLMFVEDDSQRFGRSHAVEIEGVVTLSIEDRRRDPWALRLGIRQAATHGYMRQCVALVEAADHLSKLMKRDVDVSLLADPPLGSTGTLARRSGCGVQQLWARWRSEAFHHRPKRLQQWVLVTHALLRRPGGFTWEALARILSTDAQRIRRTVRTLTERTLAEAEADAMMVLGDFEKYLSRTFRLERDGAIERLRADLCA